MAAIIILISVMLDASCRHHTCVCVCVLAGYPTARFHLPPSLPPVRAEAPGQLTPRRKQEENVKGWGGVLVGSEDK